MLIHVPTKQEFSSKRELRDVMKIGFTKYQAKVRDKEIIYVPDEELSTSLVQNETIYNNK